ELPGRLEDLQADANGALGVVLVGDRRAENGHHGVTYVLLDYAAEPLDLVAHARVVRLERRVDVLRVGGIGFGGEPDEVDEDDREEGSRERGQARRAEFSGAGRGERAGGRTAKAAGGLRGARESVQEASVVAFDIERVFV